MQFEFSCKTRLYQLLLKRFADKLFGGQKLTFALLDDKKRARQTKSRKIRRFLRV